MKNVNPSSPMFCLTLALFDTETYAEEIVPAFTKLKISYFGHEGIILRSYDIRKQAIAGKQRSSRTLLLWPGTTSQLCSQTQQPHRPPNRGPGRLRGRQAPLS